MADEVRLKQVMLNNLGNCVKFTHEGTISLKILEKQAVDGFVTYEFLFEDNELNMEIAQTILN